MYGLEKCAKVSRKNNRKNENKLPGSVQISAKDMLVTIRKSSWIDASLRQQIDGYLIDWYAVINTNTATIATRTPRIQPIHGQRNSGISGAPR